MPKIGRLTIVTGPMMAGKTSRLLALRDADPGRIYSPRADERERRTHDGRDVPCVVVDDALEIMRAEMAEDDAAVSAGLTVYRRPVYIDEAQFFRSDLLTCVRTLLLAGHDVTCAGLTMTYQGAPFGPLPLAALEADLVITLHARCSECGGPAVYTDRIGVVGPSGCGGAEAYAPRCRRHWRGGCF